MNNQYKIKLKEKIKKPLSALAPGRKEEDNLEIKVNIEAVGRDYVKGYSNGKRVYIPHDSVVYMVEYREDEENLEDDS